MIPQRGKRLSPSFTIMMLTVVVIITGTLNN